jgi:hypothetical protein
VCSCCHVFLLNFLLYCLCSSIAFASIFERRPGETSQAAVRYVPYGHVDFTCQNGTHITPRLYRYAGAIEVKLDNWLSSLGLVYIVARDMQDSSTGAVARAMVQTRNQNILHAPGFALRMPGRHGWGSSCCCMHIRACCIWTTCCVFFLRLLNSICKVRQRMCRTRYLKVLLAIMGSFHVGMEDT